LFFVEYAWDVIKKTADEIGTEVSGVVVAAPATEEMRRFSQEIKEISEGLEKRRFTLARMTSVLDETKTRASFDLEDGETLIPRSRQGSLFPACEFIDDFAGAEVTSRSRSASLVGLPIPSNSLNRSNSSEGSPASPISSRSSRSGSIIAAAIANLKETIAELEENADTFDDQGVIMNKKK